MASHPGTRQRATPAGATPCSANEASLVDALNEQGKFASTSDLRECKAKIWLALSRPLGEERCEATRPEPSGHRYRPWCIGRRNQSPPARFAKSGVAWR